MFVLHGSHLRADGIALSAVPRSRPFHLILNMAIGGRPITDLSGGWLVTDTRKDYTFFVDWIRVFDSA